METPRSFRVGTTPDWAEWTGDSLITTLAEILGPLPGLEHEFMPDRSGGAVPQVLDRYDAVIAFGYPFPGESLVGIQRLACIARWGVGFNWIDVDSCTNSSVAVALSPNAVRRPLAEGILALIFALTKNLRGYDRQIRSGRWRENLPPGMCVQGRTLGSVGLGNIAGEMFRMASGIGFGRLLAFDPYVPRERAAQLGVGLVSLETLLRESDFVAINAPLNRETEGLIGSRELSLMKPTAYLINTSRGAVVDEPALLAALEHHRIAGAGLDVFAREPMPAGHPFYEFDNVILTPHSVGWTEELIRDLNTETCCNIRAVYEGRMPEHLANPSVASRPAMQAKLAVHRVNRVRPCRPQKLHPQSARAPRNAS
jgi:phosphoglycerate dehydrogenase-like enzyme